MYHLLQSVRFFSNVNTSPPSYIQVTYRDSPFMMNGLFMVNALGITSGSDSNGFSNHEWIDIAIRS